MSIFYEMRTLLLHLFVFIFFILTRCYFQNARFFKGIMEHEPIIPHIRTFSAAAARWINKRCAQMQQVHPSTRSLFGLFIPSNV